jgi:hypothetical protein
MIKAVLSDVAGSGVLYLGIEQESLLRFKECPAETMARIDGADLGLSYNTLVFAGPDRAMLRRVKSALKRLNPPLSSWSLIGLDFHTLTRLHDNPLDYVLNVDTRRRGFSHELKIFSGVDANAMRDYVARQHGTAGAEHALRLA